VSEEPLSEDLVDLLGSERRAPGAPEGAKGRVAARLALGLSSVPAVAPAPRSASTSGAGGSRLWTRAHIVAVSVAFVAGTVAGAAAVLWLRPVSPPVIVSAPTLPLAPLPEPPPVSPVPNIVSPGPVTTASSVPMPKSPSPKASATSSSISAEQAILDTARVALGREDGDAALAATAVHAQRFPHGQLSEEREAIAIQALVLVGRAPDARARAEQFARTYPGSALLPAVREAIGP
jgi:hypothetical protein